MRSPAQSQAESHSQGQQTPPSRRPRAGAAGHPRTRSQALNSSTAPTDPPRKFLALALSLACGGLAAQPAGMQAQVGTASLSSPSGALVVTTGNGPAGYSSLRWTSFSIPAGSTVHFQQPNAASTSINRVTGGSPSELLGTLSSNGRLVLVNTAGIAFGASAVVDTAGFTASTLDAADDVLLAGRKGALLSDRSLDGETAADLTVAAQGSILARHGDVFLVGGNLTHRGRIEAREELALALEGGQVVLRALNEARVSGEVIARAGSGARGGGIDVFGPQVVLESGALLDASGPLAGGQVRVGGDFLAARAAVPRGDAPPVPTANATELSLGGTIRADATDRGHGGQVVLWSWSNTRSAGALSARGGPNGGDGGQVEVGSPASLSFASSVDTRAPQGATGELLINTFSYELLPAGTAPDPGSGMNQISVDGLAATTRYRLRSSGAVTLATPLLLPQDTSLSLEAGAELTVSAPIQASGTGSVSLRANGLLVPTDPLPATLRVEAPITAASITLRADGPGSVIDLQGAELLATQGRVELIAPSVTMAGANWLWGAQGASISGDATLAAGASLRLTGPVANGVAAAGRLSIAGLFTVQDGAQLRMALGGTGYDQIRLTGAGSAQFAGGSTLVLDLLTGAGRPTGGTYRLIDGPTAGLLLPTLQAASAAASITLAGTRLRWGSLEALVPTGQGAGEETLAGLRPPLLPEEAVGDDEPPTAGELGYEDPLLDCP